MIQTRYWTQQHYPVDLARDVWQDKMDLIDKMRKEALGEGEEEWVCKKPLSSN